MKKAIHPKIYTDAKVTCVCGNTFTTISTVPTIQVDVCSACHPLFTGKQKFLDAEGRIEKFNKKLKQTAERKAATEAVKKAKTTKAAPVKEDKKVTLKELFKQVKDEETQNTEQTETPKETPAETPKTEQ